MSVPSRRPVWRKWGPSKDAASPHSGSWHPEAWSSSLTPPPLSLAGVKSHNLTCICGTCGSVPPSLPLPPPPSIRQLRISFSVSSRHLCTGCAGCSATWPWTASTGFQRTLLVLCSSTTPPKICPRLPSLFLLPWRLFLLSSRPLLPPAPASLPPHARSHYLSRRD